MKIVFDDQIFRGQVYGGVSRYYYELGKKLLQFGNDVKIIAPLYRCKYFETDDPVKPLGFYDKINILRYRIVNNLDNFITCLLIKNKLQKSLIFLIDTRIMSYPLGAVSSVG